jgi:hypothetical protein
VKTCLGGSKYFVVMSDGRVYACYQGFMYEHAPAYARMKTEEELFYCGSFATGRARRVCHSPYTGSCDVE